MCIDCPPEPDYSDLEWCDDCRSPIFDGPQYGCECSDNCNDCGEFVKRETLVDGRCIACNQCEFCDLPQVRGGRCEQCATDMDNGAFLTERYIKAREG